jgi:hypothetical protein
MCDVRAADGSLSKMIDSGFFSPALSIREIVEIREGRIVIRSSPDLGGFKGVLGKALPRDIEIQRGRRSRRYRKLKV